jgi:hypothetical protein
VVRVAGGGVADDLAVDARAAPRACSSASSTTTPAPSPITKPSRVASNGRDARRGLSLRVESAPMLAKPPIDIGVTAASDPPAIITSASPYWIVRNASPIACALVAHADTIAKFGPCASKRIDTTPAAMSEMNIGMKNGRDALRPAA